MTRARVQQLLDNFTGVSVTVIGDIILDQFIWGIVERISPEAPVPVIQITRETIHLGGAANVAANLVALGARPVLIGVIGEDQAGIDPPERDGANGDGYRRLDCRPSQGHNREDQNHRP